MPSPAAACRRLALRLVLLAAIACLSAGPGTYDAPGAVAPWLEAPPLSLSGAQIGWLYAAYHLPNVVLLLAGGVAIDSLGADAVAAACAALVLASAALLAPVGGPPPLAVLYASRALLGAGSEVALLASQALLIATFDVRAARGAAAEPAAAAATCGRPCRVGQPDIALAFAVVQAVYFTTAIAVIDASPPLLELYGWAGFAGLLIALAALMGVSALGVVVMVRGIVPGCSAAAAQEDYSITTALEAPKAAKSAEEARPGLLVAAATMGAAGVGRDAAQPAAAAAASTPASPPPPPPGIGHLRELDAGGAGVDVEAAESDAEKLPLLPPPESEEAPLPPVRPRAGGAAAPSEPQAAPAPAPAAAAASASALSPRPARQCCGGDGGGATCTHCWLPAEVSLAPLLLHATFIIVFFTTLTPLTEILSSVLASEYDMSLRRASYARTTLKLVLIATLLTLGPALDAGILGYHALQLAGVVLTSIGTGLLAAAVPEPPEVALVFIALGQGAVLSAMWPLFNFRLPAHLRGRILGVLQTAINLVMVVVPLAIGTLRDRQIAADFVAELVAYDPTATPAEVASRRHYAPAMYVIVGGQVAATILALALALLDRWRVQRVVTPQINGGGDDGDARDAKSS